MVWDASIFENLNINISWQIIVAEDSLKLKKVQFDIIPQLKKKMRDFMGDRRFFPVKDEDLPRKYKV